MALDPNVRNLAAIRDYVEEYLDTGAYLSRTDDPREIVESLDRAFHDEGGAGITVEQMALYLKSLNA